MKHILFVILSTAFTTSVFACSMLNPPTEKELFERAHSVFRARVTETKLATLENPANPSEKVEVIEARYEIKEVFKGIPPASGIVRDMPFSPGNCGLGILPGTEYVFFPGEHEMVLLYSGSFGFFNAEGSKIKTHLEALREMSGGRQ